MLFVAGCHASYHSSSISWGGGRLAFIASVSTYRAVPIEAGGFFRPGPRFVYFFNADPEHQQLLDHVVASSVGTFCRLLPRQAILAPARPWACVKIGRGQQRPRPTNSFDPWMLENSNMQPNRFQGQLSPSLARILDLPR